MEQLAVLGRKDSDSVVVPATNNVLACLGEEKREADGLGHRDLENRGQLEPAPDDNLPP